MKFSMLLNKETKPNQAKEASLLYYLPIASGMRIDWSMAIQMALVWSEMQTASSRVWTRVVNSIS